MADLTGLLSKAKDAVSSNLGNIEKAEILIKDHRRTNIKTVKAQGGITPDALKMAKAALNQTVGSEVISQEYSVKKYIVQFNPSSLSVRGRASGFVPMLAYGADGSAANKPSQQSMYVVISMRLFFDEVDPVDAFMEDRTNVSATNLVTTSVKASLLDKGKKEVPKVQQTVEGFIAALRSPATRQIAFRWGELYYTGVLNNVSAQYVMFNTSGQPVRAYMNLSIRHVDGTVSDESLGSWENAYKRAFSAGTLDAVNGAQKAGNLLNISF